jgi:tripartite-type tricarboxylate transporter receptor subunit TctC
MIENPDSPVLKKITRRTVLSLPAAALLTPTMSRAQTAAWPNRLIRIVVPFGTGGGTDITMRLLAPKMSELLGQPIIIENRPGGGSTVGTDYVAKQPPDGYTIVLASLSSTGIAATLYPNLPYDPVKDLVAISPTVFVPIGLSVTTKGLNVKTVPEFVAALKAAPNKFSYGSAGIGTTGHLASSAFLQRTGTQAVHIPYRSPSEVYKAMISGEIQFNSDIPSIMAPFHRAGQVRMLLVATDQRSPALPEVPTAAEVGMKDYKAYSWYGLFAPAGTRQAVVDRLAAVMDQALKDPAISAKFDEMGTPAMVGYTPSRFAQYVKDEVAIWGPMVKASGARVE